jgi:hypothetical protein
MVEEEGKKLRKDLVSRVKAPYRVLSKPPPVPGLSDINNMEEGSILAFETLKGATVVEKMEFFLADSLCVVQRSLMLHMPGSILV